MRGKDGKGPKRPERSGPTWTPDESLDISGVPPALRHEVMYKLIAAKMVAVVEAVLAENGGKPIRVRIDRIQEILAMGPDTPLDRLVGAASTPTADKEYMEFYLADPAELRDGMTRDAHRQALHRMGPSRN